MSLPSLRLRWPIGSHVAARAWRRDLQAAATTAAVVMAIAAPAGVLRARASTQDPWPPAGVSRPGPGLEPPRLIGEVRPTYPPEAVRARLEGSVRLECVVNVDGTVGEVRVARSLDRAYGLDVAAVDAVKQWRFRPATRDATPVAMLVPVEVSFSLADSPRPLEWPPGFAPAGPPGGVTPREVETPELRIRVAHPNHWQFRAGEAPDQLLAVVNPESGRSVFITRPRPTTLSISFPLNGTQLQQTTQALTPVVAARGGQVTAIGQVGAGGRLWLWVEAEVPSLEAGRAAMPPHLADAAAAWESGRLWVFTSASGGTMIQVMATLLYPRGFSAGEIETQTREAGADFVRILESLVVTPR